MMREADVRKTFVVYGREHFLLHKRRTPPLNENKDPLRNMNSAFAQNFTLSGRHVDFL